MPETFDVDSHALPAFPIVEIAFTCVAADLLLVGLLLYLARRKPIGFRWLIQAVAAVLALGVMQILMLSPVGLDPFGVIHLVYVALVVAAPLSGAALWLASRFLQIHRLVLGFAFLCLLGAPLGLYATFLEPFSLRHEVATVALPATVQGNDPVRFGILADLQTSEISSYEKGAVARLLAAEPDLVLLPGDVLQPLAGEGSRFDEVAPAFRRLLKRLAAVPGGAYLVLGNVDPPPQTRELVRGTGVMLLENQVAHVSVRDRSVQVLGLGLQVYAPAARQAIAEFTANGEDGALRVVLAHVPDAVFVLPERSPVHLVVAGHTHGGQVVVPGFGPPLTLSRVPRQAAAGGLSTVHGQRLYVSRGVGHERWQAPRIRFFCPPEITLLTLQ